MKHLFTLLFCFGLLSGLHAQNLPSYLPANGLVGWWPFNGNAQDESGNGNHGTVNGAIITNDRYINVGKAYRFNGVLGSTGSHIQTTFLGLLENSSRSISVWVRRSAPLGNHTNILSWGNTNLDGGSMGVFFSTLGSPNPYVAIGTHLGYVGNQFASLTDGNWHHYAFVYDSNPNASLLDIKIYIDGNLEPINVTYGSFLINTQPSLNLVFGKFDPNGDTRSYGGDIDDVAFYNRVLTPQEITQLYQASNETSLSYQLTQEKLGNCANSLVKLAVTTRPRIKTDSAIVTGSTTATAYGNILNDGGKTITRRGFCWGTSANPTLSDSFSENGSGSGTFSGSLSALNSSTTYYLRAYAGTATEVWYGNEISFTTGSGSVSSATCGTPNIHNPNLSYGTMTDQDGNSYKTIVIGTQEWMAENLKTGHYRNGEKIPVVTDGTAWSGLTTGASCWYNNDSTSYDCPYGRLYNWYTVADQRGLCPAGWHVPDDQDWILLENNLGSSSIAGGKMKSLSGLWTSGNIASNESGFSGLPGGFRGANGPFFNSIELGYWWTSTVQSANRSYTRVLTYNEPNSDRVDYDQPGGFSVRCLKDAPETGSINSIDCGAAVNSGTIFSGQAASSVSTTINYSGGNGGIYSSRVITSTGVSGLTATLTAGNFASGNGSLSFTISGTPDTIGTASFALNIGGQSCSFTRFVVATGGGVTDIDGNTYSSVIIGNQEWMSENLKVTKYRNGDVIPTGLENNVWNSTSAGAYAIYNNDPVNNTQFGKLYNWFAVDDARGLCPTGWHVPADSEWFALENYLDPSISDANSMGTRGINAGGQMKATSTSWTSPNSGASNTIGFSALPGGNRNDQGVYTILGSIGYWWSSTSFSSTNSWLRSLYYDSAGSNRGANLKSSGFSIRCLKD